MIEHKTRQGEFRILWMRIRRPRLAAGVLTGIFTYIILLIASSVSAPRACPSPGLPSPPFWNRSVPDLAGYTQGKRPRSSNLKPNQRVFFVGHADADVGHVQQVLDVIAASGENGRLPRRFHSNLTRLSHEATTFLWISQKRDGVFR
jgi:hypothetical protein